MKKLQLFHELFLKKPILFPFSHYFLSILGTEALRIRLAQKMTIIKNILLIITFSFLIYSCEGFKLKKKSTSGEEFLIEKKDPLILPPDFSKLPEPKEQIENQDEEEKLVLDGVFNEGNSINDNNNDNEINQKSDLKKSILDKIK